MHGACLQISVTKGRTNFINMLDIIGELRDCSVLSKVETDECAAATRACEDFHKVSFSCHLGREGELACQCLSVWCHRVQCQ